MICCCCLVAKSYLTLCNAMDCNPPGSSVHGILQARILEWVAIPFSRGSSWPRDWTQVSWVAGEFFTPEPTGKPAMICRACQFLGCKCSLKSSFRTWHDVAESMVRKRLLRSTVVNVPSARVPGNHGWCECKLKDHNTQPLQETEAKHQPSCWPKFIYSTDDIYWSKQKPWINLRGKNGPFDFCQNI